MFPFPVKRPFPDEADVDEDLNDPVEPLDEDELEDDEADPC